MPIRTVVMGVTGGELWRREMKAGRFGWEEKERICLFGQTEFSVRVGQGRSGIRARLQGWQCALHQAVLCLRSQVLLIHTGAYRSWGDGEQQDCSGDNKQA